MFSDVKTESIQLWLIKNIKGTLRRVQPFLMFMASLWLCTTSPNSTKMALKKIPMTPILNAEVNIITLLKQHILTFCTEQCYDHWMGMDSGEDVPTMKCESFSFVASLCLISNLSYITSVLFLCFLHYQYCLYIVRRYTRCAQKRGGFTPFRISLHLITQTPDVAQIRLGRGSDTHLAGASAECQSVLQSGLLAWAGMSWHSSWYCPHTGLSPETLWLSLSAC